MCSNLEAVRLSTRGGGLVGRAARSCRRRPSTTTAAIAIIVPAARTEQVRRRQIRGAWWTAARIEARDRRTCNWPSADGATACRTFICSTAALPINVGMRSVLAVLELMEALKHEGDSDTARMQDMHRFVVFVVNSVSSPRTRLGSTGSTTRSGAVNLMLKCHWRPDRPLLLRGPRHPAQGQAAPLAVVAPSCGRSPALAGNSSIRKLPGESAGSGMSQGYFCHRRLEVIAALKDQSRGRLPE